MSDKKDTVIQIGDDTPSIPSTNTFSSMPPNATQKRTILYIIFALLLFIMLFISYRAIVQKQFIISSLTDTPSDTYEIFVISDRDSFSYNKKEKTWVSRFLKGTLSLKGSGKYNIAWNPTSSTLLKGKYAEGERGMELSELQYWNGKLYTFCDRTGLVYEIIDSLILPRFVLPEGDGYTSQKGFKSEWATVKDGKLFVGSTGKEWTNGKGDFISNAPKFIKVIDKDGKIDHIDWSKTYDMIRDKLGCAPPGYVVHEAVSWSSFHKKWFFLPRRVSKIKYDEEDEFKRGSNHLVIVDEDFSKVEIKEIGTINPTRGFSTLKFIPGRPNEIVAIKTEEEGDKMMSYLMIFNHVTGEILYPETLIENEKFEGIEIRPVKA